MESGDAAPHRHPPRAGHRLGSDCHRPGVRVRLLGNQACKALRAEGLAVVLVNSNPATIMTDPTSPTGPTSSRSRRRRSRRSSTPSARTALLPTVGGQTASTSRRARRARHAGAVRRQAHWRLARRDQGCRGAPDLQGGDAVDRHRGADERHRPVARAGLALISRVDSPRSSGPRSRSGRRSRHRLQHPRVPESGRAWAEPEPAHEVLIEQSVIGGRNRAGGDARRRGQLRRGVLNRERGSDGHPHRDSITVAPAMTLSDKEYQRMRDAAKRIIRRVGVETGGSNIQFAVNPTTADGGD